MPKRPASTGILCPGCSANFDMVTHVPFMGSCGDSICSVCLNEKKIKDCPDCNLEGGFTWNQKNNLALKFLSAAAEKEATDSKKAKLDVGEETCASDEPVPAILDPNNRHFLAQIVNQLNPRSFVNLASTCKTLHNYCFNCKDLKITYDIFSLKLYDYLKYALVERRNERKPYGPDQWSHSHEYAGYRYGFLRSAAGRTKLKNYPFAFRLEELRIETVANSEFFESRRTFLAQFPVQTITKVVIWKVRDWNGLMQFLKDFHIKELRIQNGEFPEGTVEMFVDSVQNLNLFYCNIFFPERLILNLVMPMLYLLKTEISKNTFTQLVKKWTDSTDDFECNLKSFPFDFDVDSLFEDVFPFYHKGPISSKRPLAFYKKHKSRKFYVLRKDGKMICCSVSYNTLIVGMMSPSYFPPCLLPDSDVPVREWDSDDYSEDEPEPDVDSDDEPESEAGSGDESSD